MRDALEITFRIWHPDQDPDFFSRILELEPSIAYRAREPRKSAAGTALGSLHRETLWTYDLKGKPDASLSSLIEEMEKILSSREAPLKRLCAEGARLEYFVGIFLSGNRTEDLSAEVLAKCAKRGVTLVLNIYGQDSRD